MILNLRLVSELWKDVGLFKGIDFTGYYKISSKGNLIGLDRTIMDKNGKEYHRKGCVMHPGFNKGYLTITLKKNGAKRNAQLHQLVAIAFLINPNKYTIVNHKDLNPANNDVNNLEWCTAQYNATYMDAHIKRGENLSIGVTQLTLNGEFVKNWTSAFAASRQSEFTQSGINYCVNGRRHRYCNFIWLKTEDYNKMTQEEVVQYCYEKTRLKVGVRIKQTKSNGKSYIWNSIRSAQIANNLSPSLIRNAIRDKTIYADSLWELA